MSQCPRSAPSYRDPGFAIFIRRADPNLPPENCHPLVFTEISTPSVFEFPRFLTYTRQQLTKSLRWLQLLRLCNIQPSSFLGPQLPAFISWRANFVRAYTKLRGWHVGARADPIGNCAAETPPPHVCNNASIGRWGYLVYLHYIVSRHSLCRLLRCSSPVSFALSPPLPRRGGRHNRQRAFHPMTKTAATAELSATTKARRDSKSARRRSSQLGKTGASKERRESNASWIGGHSNRTGNAATGGSKAGGSRDANRLRRIVMDAVRSEAPKEEGG